MEKLTEEQVNKELSEKPIDFRNFVKLTCDTELCFMSEIEVEAFILGMYMAMKLQNLGYSYEEGKPYSFILGSELKEAFDNTGDTSLFVSKLVSVVNFAIKELDEKVWKS